jgi:hypothetical protein
MRLLVLLALLVVTGCANSGAAPDAPEPGQLTFSYRAFGGDDEIDQVLEITNGGQAAVAPTLEITPLDRAGRPIPGVAVSSAYGSERGRRVVPAQFTDIDLLHFEGKRAGDVRDVRVRVKRVEPVDAEVTDVLAAQRYAGDRRIDSFDEPFDSVELRNPNADAVKAQIVVIGWDAARHGNPQQWKWVRRAGPPVGVAARGRTMVRLPAELTGISTVSMKAYILKTP